MFRTGNRGWSGLRSTATAAIGTLGVFLFAGAAAGKDAGTNTTVERIVESAQEARLAGDAARQFALLREAVRLAPNFELARWQLGHVQVEGEWLPVEEAQRRATADPRQAQYRERRQALGESPQGQLELARWCRRNGLEEEAWFHWASVLSVEPTNIEAQRAMGMRWQNGRLLTREEAERQRSQLREAKRAERTWSAAITKWRRAVSGRDAEQRDAALEEIRTLTSAEAVFALEKVTLGRDAADKKYADECRQISLALLEALDKMPAHAATESLVRHAVFAPFAEAVQSAVEKLKSRPQHDYVPLLLAGLSMPIESSFHVKTDADGSVHYWHSLYREGADRDWAVDARFTAMQYDLGGRRTVWDVANQRLEVGPPTGSEPRALRQKASVTSRYQSSYGNTALRTEMQVRQANQQTEALNGRIIPVLAATTGQDLGDSAKAWWDWWREENEYYVSDDKEVDKRYVSNTDSFYYGRPSLEYPRPPTSCFARGTLVWTKTGQQPIESLELGDLVLAQNVNTGELAYKPVIGRTVRPPSPIVKLRIDGEELRATLGHPLWVAGVGWRMAKELDDGAILHGVTGSPRIVSVEADGEEEAYNLVVADFNTYFVGERGVLAHDNTPRRPTRATVPGLAAK